MKVGLSVNQARDSTLLLQIKKVLDYGGFTVQLMRDGDYRVARDVDLIISAGGDRGILDYFHKVVTDSAPVLGIYESDSTGFLAQLDVRDLEASLNRIEKGNFEIDQVFRIAAKVDGKEVEPVLNDVAIFPSKSATLMEHVLRIDEKTVWRDNSDGLILSTPTGSTAYSMSAGGPMVLQKSQVFVVVSVNSLDNTRRPLIIPNDTTVEVADIASRYHCEIVLDGGTRMGIKKSLQCSKHQVPAKLVRLSGNSSIISLIAKKVRLAEDLLSMPPSAKLLLKTLEYEGALSQRDLSTRTMLPERTVRLALRHLLTRGYVKKKTSLRDARQRTYELRL